MRDYQSPAVVAIRTWMLPFALLGFFLKKFSVRVKVQASFHCLRNDTDIQDDTVSLNDRMANTIFRSKDGN